MPEKWYHDKHTLFHIASNSLNDGKQNLLVSALAIKESVASSTDLRTPIKQLLGLSGQF
jgi:hypothetical protein